MNLHIRQPQHDTASRKLEEDQWRVVALYLQTADASPLEALFLNDLLLHWHGPLTDRQEKQLMSMYLGVVGDHEFDEDEIDDIDEAIVRKFVNGLH